MEFLMNYPPVLLALLAGLFTWGVTALGAGMVFFFKEINIKVLNGMLGFASGVMIAASFWSLLAPAIVMAEGGALPPYLVVAIGFLGGGFFLWVVDRVLPHIHQGTGHQEGVKTSWQRSVLLVLAITFHNIPEGLAVGVAFGGLAIGNSAITLTGAISLALGIGLQNFPEGAAVSIPLRREKMSRTKSFLVGQFSGMVEPIAAVLGAAAVVYITPLLPYALAFAAGAMIYVVAEELIPESQLGHEGDIATVGLMVGFTLMMVLDVALG
ncbi:MAG: ZIP family metal transporter [Eubacteriaceae bacterium]